MRTKYFGRFFFFLSRQHLCTVLGWEVPQLGSDGFGEGGLSWENIPDREFLHHFCISYLSKMEKWWIWSVFGDHTASKHGFGALALLEGMWSCVFLWHWSCRMNDIALGKKTKLAVIIFFLYILYCSFWQLPTCLNYLPINEFAGNYQPIFHLIASPLRTFPIFSPTLQQLVVSVRCSTWYASF